MAALFEEVSPDVSLVGRLAKSSNGEDVELQFWNEFGTEMIRPSVVLPVLANAIDMKFNPTQYVIHFRTPCKDSHIGRTYSLDLENLRFMMQEDYATDSDEWLNQITRFDCSDAMIVNRNDGGADDVWAVPERSGWDDPGLDDWGPCVAAADDWDMIGAHEWGPCTADDWGPCAAAAADGWSASPPEVVCFHCGKSGHLLHQCPVVNSVHVVEKPRMEKFISVRTLFGDEVASLDTCLVHTAGNVRTRIAGKGGAPVERSQLILMPSGKALLDKDVLSQVPAGQNLVLLEWLLPGGEPISYKHQVDSDDAGW